MLNIVGLTDCLARKRAAYNLSEIHLRYKSQSNHISVCVCH